MPGSLLIGGLLLPDTGKTWVCRGCGAEFPEAAEITFVRHADRCPENDADKLMAEVEQHRAEPLSQTDSEQVAWLRKDAIERGLDPLSHGPRSRPKLRPRKMKGVAGH